MAVLVSSLQDLGLVAAWLKDFIVTCGPTPILLYGDLGSGKTTLVKLLVELLPGAEFCEPASPSFNLCNFYPVSPPVYHYDLYRSKFAIPEDLYEVMDNPENQILVEWAEYLPRTFLPENYLDIIIKLQNNYRLLDFKAHGRELEKKFKNMILPLER